MRMSREPRTPAGGSGTERTARVVWRILRLDDNGNRFVVAECAAEAEAQRIAAEFIARGHKQAYWVECDGDGGEGNGRGCDLAP